MRAALLALGSVVLTTTVIGNAYFQKQQFYPSVVYITKSNPSMAVIYLQAFVFVLLMGKLVRKVFFGQLRAAEMEHLIERSWYAVTETCLAFTVFREDFSPKFVALFTLLLFLKCFHWLAEDRVDYMERSPVISYLFHLRVASLLMLLGGLDNLFVGHAYHSTLTKGASVQLVFGFEYAILLTVVMNIFIKYVLHTIDLQRDNPWENKAVYLLYTELVMGFIKVILYLTFMFIMIKIHTFPLFAIRPMYLSMRAFKKAVNDVIMSSRAIRNMNTLYPDATPEDLASVDNVCIICREEMTGAAGASKKLPCNHIFHSACLRSWFQRQQTCPTCRMDVLRLPNGMPRGGEAAAQAGAQPQAAPGAAPQMAPGQVPNWPGLPPMGGAFPFLFAVQQQQQQQQQQAAAAAAGRPAGAAAPQPGSEQPSSSNASASNQSGASTSNRPAQAFYMPPVPLFPFCFLPPPPMPSADFSGLTREELEALEGRERENVEARIRCLRNIQTLLDAAVMQMQQYSSVVNLRSPETNNQSSPISANRESSPGTSTSETNAAQEGVPRNPSAQEGNSSDPQSEIRRRRLERFLQGNGPN